MECFEVDELLCVFCFNYSFSHNHGSGKWPYLKGNYYWGDPFLISMIMGGSVDVSLKKVDWWLAGAGA